jgi:hypothetical protein
MEIAESLMSEIVPAGELGEPDRAAMFRLYERYYDAADRDRFEADLAEKQLVVVVRAAGLVGFTTIAVDSLKIGGSTVHYLFSGDTVLDASHWGDPILLRAWFRAAGAVKANAGAGRLFWFTVIKGHRTFRILPNFFRRFVPAPEGAADPGLLDVRNRIAVRRYGDCFDPETGLVDFGCSLGHLRAEWADAEAAAGRNRHAAFFLRANPRYASGVELACLAEFDPGNLLRYAAASFDEGTRHGG